jgi:transposase
MMGDDDGMVKRKGEMEQEKARRAIPDRARFSCGWRQAPARLVFAFSNHKYLPTWSIFCRRISTN